MAEWIGCDKNLTTILITSSIIELWIPQQRGGQRMMKYLKFLILMIINYHNIPRHGGCQKKYLKHNYQLSKFEYLEGGVGWSNIWNIIIKIYLDGGVGRSGQAVTDCSQFQAPHRLEGWTFYVITYHKYVICARCAAFIILVAGKGCRQEPLVSWRKTAQKTANPADCTWIIFFYLLE